MAARGLFITIEGGEGVGKSTNITFLMNYLTRGGIDIVTTREPGGTELGEEIRSLLLQTRSERICTVAELLLIFAARAQHIRHVIEPALSQGRWVLCDRFTDATYAYQCGGRGIQAEVVSLLEQIVQNELRPDHTLLLDAPVAVGMSRARSRGMLDRFEQESPEFFERVRASYLELANASGGRFHILDVGRPLVDVQRELLEFANKLISHWYKSQQPS
jgi:dTMP kinase